MSPVTHRIAPRLLSADFARLAEEVKTVIAAGADWFHFDVMDNHYVPNLTFGPMVCEALRKHAVTAGGARVPIDVHLMVQPVDALAQARRLIERSGRDIRLEVDGGIKTDNIRAAADAGADTFVAGSAIFSQPDYRVVIDAMRERLSFAAGSGARAA